VQKGGLRGKEKGSGKTNARALLCRRRELEDRSREEECPGGKHEKTSLDTYKKENIIPGVSEPGGQVEKILELGFSGIWGKNGIPTGLKKE